MLRWHLWRFVAVTSLFLLIASAIPVVSAGTNRLNLQTRIVDKTTGVNINTISPACIKSGQDTCDFRIRIWSSSSSTDSTPTTGYLMFTQTFQDVEIGDTDGIINLSLNSCGSTQVGLSQWGTSVGTCTVQLDNANTGSAGVDFSRSDLWIEFSFAPADTNGSLGTFTEVFSRSTLDQVPSAISADTLNGLKPSDFVQFAPSATQISTSTNSLINLQTTASTTSPLVLVNENGTGTPDLLQLQVAGNNKLLVSNSGNITTTATATATSTTTTFTGSNSTTLTVASTTSFAVGDLIFVNGINFARVVSIDSASQMTISPGLTWSASQSVVKYSTPSIGDASNIANRYNTGYFLNGVVTGSGTTTYADQQISSSGNFRINANDININSTGLTNLHSSEVKITKNQLNNPTGSWSVGKTGDMPRDGFISQLYNGKIYYWGGGIDNSPFWTNSLVAYDLTSNTWETGVAGGTARNTHSSAIYNNKMYVFGGWNGSYLVSTDIYDFQTATWSTGGNMSANRTSFSSVVYNNKIYAWGGTSGSNLNTMDVYDFATGSWSPGTTGGTARRSHTAVVHEDKMYVWGGVTTVVVNTMNIYNFTTNTWSTGTAGGTARQGHSAVVYNNKMYIWGGRLSGFTYLNTVDIYDFITGTWSTGLTGGTARHLHSADIYNNKMYVWGGNNGARMNTMDIFDFGTYDTVLSLYAGTQEKFKVDAGGNTYLWGNLGIGTTSSTSSNLKIASATTARSQINFVSSAGVNPASPTTGDLWWNGTNLNFRTASSTIDLLAAAMGGTPVSFALGSVQNSTNTNTLIDIATTGTLSTPLIRANENGAGTADLLALQVAGANKLLVSNIGDISTTASLLSGNTTTTGTGTSSSALTVASTASFNIGDLLLINGTTYTRVIGKDTTTQFTVSPAVSWSASQSVTRYTLPNIGSISNIENMYNKGYFVNGLVTGGGTTTYEGQKVSSTSSLEITAGGYIDLKTNNFVNLNTNGLIITQNSQDNVTGTWSTGKPGGTPRYQHTTVLYNGKMYVWGGVNNSSVIINTLDAYDLNTQTWTSLTAGGTGREFASAVVYNKKMYIWGGRTTSPAQDYNTLDIYDFETDTWSVGTAGGTARSIHRAVIYNNKMYAWGGSIANNPTNTMDIYDFSTNSWSTGTAGGGARYNHSQVVYNNKMYVWSGNNGGTSMYQYDFNTDTWSGPVNTGSARDSHLAFVYNDSMYVFNGATTNWSGFLNTVDIYNFKTGTWSSGTTGGANPRYRGGGVLYNGKVYIHGGYTGAPYANTMDIYDLGINSTGISLVNGISQTARIDARGNAFFGGDLLINTAFQVANGGATSITSATNANLLSITSTAASATNALIYVNENGTGTPDLLDLQIAGTSVFAINNNGDIKIVDGTTKNIVDSAGNNLVQITDIATNFGASVEAGAVVSRNSYFGEEFMRPRANITADTLVSWGDQQSFGVDVNTTCTFSNPADLLNGIGRITVGAANSNCLAYQSDLTTANNPNLIYNASNLPLIIMKVRPSNVGANDRIYVGLGNAGTATNTEPTAGLFFTNNLGTTWAAFAKNGGPGGSFVTCTGATISTTQFALLKIEVRSSSDVRFYVDPDVSNGVQWTNCGTVTTLIPAVGLTSMLQVSSTTAARTLDIDYFRVWQDDAALPTDTPEITSTPTATPSPTIENTEVPTATPTGIPSQTLEEAEALSNLAKLTGLRFESLNDAAEIQISPALSTKSISLVAPKVSVKGNLIVNGMLEVVGDLFVRGNLTVEGTITAKNLQLQEQLSPRGTIKIAAGKDSASVTFAKEFPTTPFILVEPKGEYVPFTVTNKTEKGFTIEMKEPTTKELTFEWIAVK